MVVMENGREEAAAEISGLQRHLAEVQEDQQAKERNFRASLDEARQIECQLSEDRCKLERSLDEIGNELVETRLDLSAAEGRVSALESQLTQVRLARNSLLSVSQPVFLPFERSA